MANLVDYELQQRDEGVGFRLLFNDHTWKDTDWILLGEELTWDYDGFSELEAEVGYAFVEKREDGQHSMDMETLSENDFKSYLIQAGFIVKEVTNGSN